MRIPDRHTSGAPPRSADVGRSRTDCQLPWSLVPRCETSLVAEDLQFCTDFSRAHGTLSAALARRDRDMDVLVDRLTEELLLTEDLDGLVEKVLSTKAGEPDGVGLPESLWIEPLEMTQRLARQVDLRGEDYEDRIQSWAWQLDFRWGGAHDLFGRWPDQTAGEYGLKTYDNHPSGGCPPTIKWTINEDRLTATCYEPRHAQDHPPNTNSRSSRRSQGSPPLDLVQEAAEHAEAYANAFNRQVSAWKDATRERVAELLRQRRALLLEGEAHRAQLNELLQPFRAESDEDSAAPSTTVEQDEVVEVEAAPDGPPIETEEWSPMSEADVVILTALEKEAAAFAPHLRGWREGTGHRRYFTGEASDLRVVVWPIGGMGNVRSGVAAQQAIAIWNPGCILVAGIAAALDREEVALGDVLVPEQLVAYEPGRVGPDGVTKRWEVFRTSSAVLQAARSVASSDWQLEIVGAPPDRSEPPQAHFGVVLSGEKVVASADRASDLTAVWDRSIGLEMEGVGVALAAYEGSVPLVGLVKGVCDYADEAKTDRWQNYAAATSATFVTALISRLLLPRDQKQPQRTDSPLSTTAPRAGWGPPKVKLCRRLTDVECRELADCFEIEPHERERWSDDLCDEVWSWLVRRDKLGELPDMLRNCLEREDLVDVIDGLQPAP